MFRPMMIKFQKQTNQKIEQLELENKIFTHTHKVMFFTKSDHAVVQNLILAKNKTIQKLEKRV